jgi:hypothetical protein
MAAQRNSSTEPLTPPPYENERPTPSIATPSRIRFYPIVTSLNKTSKNKHLKKTYSNFLESTNKDKLNNQIKKFTNFNVKFTEFKKTFNKAITDENINIARKTYNDLKLLFKMMRESYASLNNNATQYTEFMKIPRKVKLDMSKFILKADSDIKQLENKLANSELASTDVDTNNNQQGPGQGPGLGGRRRTKHHKKHRAKHHTHRRAHRHRTHRRRAHRQ